MSSAERQVDHSVERFQLTPSQSLKNLVKSALGLTGTKRVKILAGPGRGVTMTLDFYGHTPMYLGMYEMELHRFSRPALRGASLVFDVGGYIGYDALMFAANCTGQVITFEPDPVRITLLRDNIAQNPSLAPRISVNPLALGSEEGDGVTSLDLLSTTIGAPDFVKVDTDGFEADILRGGRELFRSRHPNVIVETHSLALENECGLLLSDYGYRPVVKHNRRIWREFRGLASHNRWLLAAGDSRANSCRT